MRWCSCAASIGLDKESAGSRMGKDISHGMGEGGSRFFFLRDDEAGCRQMGIRHCGPFPPSLGLLVFWLF